MQFTQLRFFFFFVLSAIFSVQANSQPIIALELNEIQSELLTGEVEEHVINVFNEGDELLRFTLEHDLIAEPERDPAGPVRDDLGDEIAAFEIEGEGWFGIAWDGELMWGISFEQRRMTAFDPENEEIVENINLNGNYLGMAFDGEFFWAGLFRDDDQGSGIARISREGNIDRILNLQAQIITGVAYDGENLWCNTANFEREAVIINQVTTEGQVLREIDITQIVQGGFGLSLAWAEMHDDGHLWLIAWNQERIIQLDVSGEEPEIVQEAQIERGDSFGLEHDGEHLWYSGNNNIWRVIDDGVSEANWLSYEPDQGELEPDEDVDIIVTLDADGLFEGVYEADLHFLSNDPEDPDLVVSILLEVTGVPILEAVWDEDFGFPGGIDWNRAFEDVFVEGEYPLLITVINAGTADLVAEEAFCEEEAFSVEPDNFELAPREEIELELTFSPDAAGAYNSDLTIVWNAPDDEDYTVPLTALAFNPPEINVEPQAIEVEMLTGDVEEHIINILNDGVAVLRFEIEKEIIAEPERDVITRRARKASLSAGQGPQRDELGDILQEFQIDRASWSGLAWDGELMYGINFEQMQMVAFDPEREEIVEEINLGARYLGMAFDGEFFWSSRLADEGQQPMLARYDREGEMIDNIVVQGVFIYCVAFDGENLWYYGINFQNENIVLRQINFDGEILREIEIGNVIDDFGLSMCWADHPEGNIWTISWGRGVIQQIDISADQPEIVQEARIEASNMYGLEHDGENLWYSTNQGVWYVIDDGVQETNWLRFEPESGAIEPGEDMDISVTIDADGLFDGEYEAELHVLSNDPDDPDIIVIVFADVTGAPVLRAEWDEDFGWPDVVNWNAAYEDLFVGRPCAVPITIVNAGADELIVEGLNCENEEFNVQDENFRLDPREEREIQIILDTQEPGEYESLLTIEWNSPHNEVTEVALHGETSFPPIILVEPQAIELDLPAEEQAERILNIFNEGPSLLRFTLELENINQPEQDNAQRLPRLSKPEHPIGPIRDDFGDIIRDYNVFEAFWTGIAWDGELMWGISQGNVRFGLVSFNPVTEEIVNEIQIENSYFGLAFDGEAFWTGNADEERDARFNRIDRNGNVLETINAEGMAPTGVAFDGENLWYHSIDFERDGIIIRQITMEGEQQREIDCSNIFRSRMISIEYVSEHPEGSLWAIEWETGILYQIDISEQEMPQVVNQTQIENGNSYGLEHDGVNLWYCRSGAEWIVLDDGITECSWVSFEPESGELEEAEDLDIIVSFNSEGLVEGEYAADLRIESNDPNNPEIVVALVLNVGAVTAPPASNVPEKFNLSQAYPNPFNAQTRLNYALAKESKVSIKIYDLNGNLVQTLIEGKQPAGRFQTVWNGINAANGVYLVKMEAGEFNAVRKVTMVK